MKLHKSIALLLSLALLLSMVLAVAFPAQAERSGYYTYTVSNGEATITDCETYIRGQVTIPRSLGGYPVTSIGNGAFAFCTGLTSITIPDSVTSIGIQAFCDCTSLTSVTIPDSVTSIGYGAFWGSTGLTSITIPDSVTSIGSYAFYNCTGLTSITIGDSVTSIGDEAFENCTGLTGITIPDSVTSIGDKAFKNCIGLTSVTIPDSVTSIGSWAFEYCSSLTSVTIGDSVTSIGSWAFDGCTSLTYNTYDNGKYLGNSNNPYYVILDTVSTDITACTIHEDAKIIGYETFEDCTGLTSVTIPDSVTSIGDEAFENCTGLTGITIPDSVTSIGDEAFENCTGLTGITIPDSVTSIGSYAFSYCTSLSSIQVADGNSVYHSAGNCLIKTASKALILGCKNSQIPQDGSVTSIGSYAFYGCTGLTSITIPDSVTSIGSSAFSSCTGLTSITIPDSVTSVGDRVFYGCTGLTSVTIPDSVTSIGTYAFYNCTSLTHVFYAGTETQKAAITVGSSNAPLTDATWHYEVQEVIVDDEAYYYCPECDMTFSADGGEMKGGTVKFLDEDGSVISEATYHYGGAITVPEAPTKAADKTYTYTFAGWGENFSEICVGDATYTATYTPNYIDYTVTFKAEDGSVHSTKTYHYGDTVTAPEAPAKAADKTYTYPFAGWGENFSEICVGDATYTATYTPTYIEYTVEFKDWDGSTLSSKTYHYGDVVDLPAISGRPADEKYTYVFTGWNKTVVDCEGDAVYTARYTPIYINYTVTFLDWNGEVISEKTYHYGDTVEIPEDPTRAQVDYYTYSFTGWDKEISAACAGNATYTATYEEKIVLQEALASGGTVKLVKDTQVDYLTIGNGATLDLNGYTLTADYFTSYGTVVDGTDGGNALVKVNKGIHLATENEFMPIYDSANGGYRFYRYELQNLGYKAVDSGTVKAGFRLTFANTSGYDVLSTTTDVALDTVALVSWTGSMGVTHYTFSDDTLRNYAAMAAADIASKGSTSKAMTLTLTGVDSLGENASVQFQPTVETAPGMIAQGADKTWTAQ